MDQRIMKGSVAGLVVAAVCVAVWCERATRPLPPIEVCFSPKGGCTEAIVKEIDAARTSLLVQAYSFTSAPIAQAVAAAQRRGVRVEVILDSSQKTEKYSSADFLRNAGVAVLIDSRHAIAHNKIIIIDDEVVVTGSFNFTKSAEESNAENLLIIRDQVLAQQYTENWKAHAAHSEPYSGRNEEASPHTTPRHKGL
jgi:phosphatidylserine/phosphatidylglycerophosphate/cardiolipin synthase-like enzyme